VVLGPRAQGVRDSFLYKAFLDWPLRALGALVGALRRAPATQGLFVVASLVYALLSAVVVVEAVQHVDKLRSLPLWTAAMFVGVPVLLLAASVFLLAMRRDDAKSVHLLRGVWLLLQIGAGAAVVAVLYALVAIDAGTLCRTAIAAAAFPVEICGSRWALRSIEIGRAIIVLGAVLMGAVTPITRCLRPLVAALRRRSKPNASAVSARRS